MKTYTVFGYRDDETIQRVGLEAEDAYDLGYMLECEGFIVSLIKE